MAQRIVVDVRTLAEHSSELVGLSGQLRGQGDALRGAVGFLLGRPDLPNGAALATSFSGATRSLDEAAELSVRLAGAVAQHAQRVLDCENGMLRSGDGPYARPGPAGGGGGGGGLGLGGLSPLGRLIAKVDAAVNITQAMGNVGQAGLLLTRLGVKTDLAHNVLILRALNSASVDKLAALEGISKSSARAIIAGRAGGKYEAAAEVGRALKGTQGAGQKTAAAERALDEYALARRIAAAERLEGRAGSVTSVLGGARLAGKLAPGMKIAGKVFAPVDVAVAGYGVYDQFKNNKNDPHLLGNDYVEKGMSVVSLGAAVGGAAVTFGLIANPVGITVVAVVAVGVVVYQYGPAAWGAAKKYGPEAAHYVGHKAGEAAGYVGDKAGDAAGWAGDKAGDAAGWAEGKAGSATKKVGHKLGSAGHKIASIFS